MLEAYSPKVILSPIRSPKMSEPASAENPTEDEAATKANPTASTQAPQEIEPVYVNARKGGPLERRVKWISGPQYYPGYGDGKAAQDFSAPVLPDEFPPIAAQNRKFYNADFARKRLESSLEFEKSIVLEKGICGLCRGIFDDEEGKKGFKVFPYHEDIFRVVVSARVGCGVCRLFLQSVKEYGNGSFFESMGGASGYMCVYMEEWVEIGARRCYLTWTINERHASLWKFDAQWIFPAGLAMKFYEEADNPEESLPEEKLRADYPSRLSNSRESLGLAKTWLSRCEATHEICRNARNKSKPMPTRLVYVGGKAIRLCLPSEREYHIRYATLSHCWGKIEITRLESDNINQFLEEIPESALCKTFRHAIEITRAAGLDYLWIDSLCIIQHDAEDWSREAARMADVYGQSVLSIAASSAIDGSQGCFFDRDLRYAWHHPIEMKKDGKTERFIMGNTQAYARCVRNTELSKRAWVVQERLLAPKTLHFSKSQVFWECKEVNACESYPNGLPDFLDMDRGLDGLDKRSLPSWYKVVHLYSRCSLTFGKDKLPALMGIAKMFQEQTGDIYLAGLWKENLRQQLTWRIWSNPVPPEYPRPDEPRAPSWSWTAVEGDKVPILMSEHHRKGDAEWCVEVISANVSQKDEAGAIWEGTLELSCERILSSTAVYFPGLSDRKAHLSRTGEALLNMDVSMAWDYDDHRKEPYSERYVVPFTHGTGSQVVGLVLEQTGNALGQYRRAGMFSIEKGENIEQLERLFENCVLKEDDYVSKSSDGKERYIITII